MTKNTKLLKKFKSLIYYSSTESKLNIFPSELDYIIDVQEENKGKEIVQHLFFISSI